jgi:hypothetical protein
MKWEDALIKFILKHDVANIRKFSKTKFSLKMLFRNSFDSKEVFFSHPERNINKSY